MELIVEVVSRNEKVLSLHKLTGDQITIGRAYDNDLVLQEEHVSPHHAHLRIDDNGQLLLCDNDSINGIKDKKNKPLARSIHVSTGDVFVLGKVFIRVIVPSQPVVEAKKINFIEDLFRACNHWFWAVLAILVYAFLLLVGKYYETYREVVWSQLAISIIMSALVMFVVPVLIAIAARIFKKDVKFFTITCFSYIIAIGWLISQSIGSLLLFNWGDLVAVHLGGELISYGLLMLFLLGAFHLATSMAITRIVVVSSCLVLCVASLVYINETGDDKVKLFPAMRTTILPSDWLLAGPIEASEFSAETLSLFEKATLEAERRNAEANE